MRILIITQKVDRNDPILGFFHRWIEEFAKHYEQVTVICLERGEYDLPPNTKVMSLGKEEGNLQFSIFNLQKFKYIFRFYKYIWQERDNYDAVFVHMNQEYVLLGWKCWFLLGKPVYLWRNHAKGNFLTRLAILLSKKVFYTSPQSYTAKFGKAVQMPVGIDTEFFKPDPSIVREPNSMLFLGRISPVKKVLEFVEWFNALPEGRTATVAGAPLPYDLSYDAEVRAVASVRINFVGAVTQAEALKLYQSHETYVNKTSAGSFDKTIFEAAACEMKVMVDNEDLKFMESKNGPELREFVVEKHGLLKLMDKFRSEMI